MVPGDRLEPVRRVTVMADFGDEQAARRNYRRALWICLAVVSCLSVTLLNGQPLYYYDSVGYLDTGAKALRVLDLIPAPADLQGGSGGISDDGVINGSRSVVYALFSAASTYWLGALSVPVFHMLSVLGVTAFLVSILMRGLTLAPRRAPRMMGLALFAAGLGSLPFFVAYFMPDILAGLMILTIAVLVLAWPVMAWWEILLVLVFGAGAVLSHPSHLLIAAVLVPVAALAGGWLHGRRWWVSTLLAGLLVLAGVGERLVFTALAHDRLDAEVTYYPFLTARLIQDGAGYDFLQETCPSTDWASCTLYDQLKLSDDPMRRTASHILFEFSESLGTLRLLPADIQSAIAAEQTRFAVQTFLSRPADTIMAVVHNTAVQAGMVSVWMTVPEPSVMEQFKSLDYFAPEVFQGGRLIDDHGWVDTVDRFQGGYYVLCLVVLAGMFFWPGRMRPEFRIFVLLVLAGILANAFVCGAVSQPADRYGARVIWLLPFITMLAWLMRPGTPREG